VHGREAAAVAEVDHHAAPFGGTAQVGDLLARDERLAAGVADDHGARRLPAHRHGHGLVEEGHALLPLSRPHECHADLREGGDLEIGIAELSCQLERTSRVRLGDGGLAGAFGELDLERAALGAGPDPVQASLCPCQPPLGGGVVRLPDAVAERDEDRRGGCPAGVAALPVRDICALPRLARRARVGEHGERDGKAVQRTRLLGRLCQDRLEARLGARPVAVRERLLSRGPCVDPRLRCHEAHRGTKSGAR
jgi:hypothetical protein